jgi:hypothetical protein
MAQTLLLDAHETGRRLLQNGLPLLGGALLLAGVAVMVAPTHAYGQGITALVLGFGLLLWCPTVLLRWDVEYKGHAIRFENSVVFGERLYIDGTRITKGPLGYRKTLQGAIRGGDGDGERITAESEAGLTIFRVRIVADTP